MLIQALHSKIWRVAWPMIVANLSVPLLGLVDTALLGHLEKASYLGAVALGGAILAFVYWGFGFLRMGTTGITAQAFGRQDSQGLSGVLIQSVLLGLAIALMIVAVHPLLFDWGLSIMAPPPDSYDLANSYLTIRILGAPAVLVNYALIGWMIGQQDTRGPLLMVTSANLLNLILDVWFIAGLDWKSDGAASATVISEYASCLLGLWLCIRKCRLGDIPLLWHSAKDRSSYLHLLKVNRHLFVRTLALLSCIAMFTAQGAAQGEVILAANAVLLNLLMLISYGLDGVAHSAEALCGEAKGQGDGLLLRQIIIGTTQWSLGFGALFTLLFWLPGSGGLSLFTDQADVLTEAQRYYPWLVAMPLLALWSYLLDGIYIGITETQAMRNSMLFSLFLVFLPIWAVTQDSLGNHGLWLAFATFNLCRGVTLGLMLPPKLRVIDRSDSTVASRC